jgi:hypothetical protein
MGVAGDFVKYVFRENANFSTGITRLPGLGMAQVKESDCQGFQVSYFAVEAALVATAQNWMAKRMKMGAAGSLATLQRDAG